MPRGETRFTSRVRTLHTILCMLLAAALTGLPAQGQRIDLDPPGEREFVLDLAGLLSADDVKAIQASCDKLLTEHATPIIVVTIERMANHGGRTMRIETFAHLLFDQWQVGHAKLGEKEWNTGILLLVSKGDRRARIQLGAGWGRDKDALCSRIMDDRIVPLFKAGDFGGGIRAGVEALDAMARSKPLPEMRRPPTPWWHYLVVVGFIGLAIFTVVSLIRRGASGWAWLFWGALFGFVGYMLYQAMANRGGSGGGGFGGGSFGGGFSGGGGATGSW